MSDTESSTTPAEDLVGACVVAVQNALGLELDFTPDTLPILDHYAQMAAESGQEETIQLVTPMAGAYFGELVRRHLGPARWHAPDDYQEWRIEMEQIFLHFNPVGVALEVLLQEDAPGWSAHFSVLEGDRTAVRKALDLLGDVESDDYYRFSVRWEVLDQVVATLTQRALTSGDTHRVFSAEVYQTAVSAREASDPPS